MNFPNWKFFIDFDSNIFPFRKEFDNENWENTFDFVTLPNLCIGASEIDFYLEVIPATADYNLDNVTMEIGEADFLFKIPPLGSIYLNINLIVPLQT